MSTETLDQLEKRIFKSVLKHSVCTLNYTQKQFEFKETCFAIKEIIQSKLYRFTFPNLEQYFLKKFGVSRAQVYRLLDAYHILEQLQDFKRIPHRYRICKELKSFCSNGVEMRRVWNYMINQCHTETDIENFQLASFDKSLALSVDADNLSQKSCFEEIEYPGVPPQPAVIPDDEMGDFASLPLTDPTLHQTLQSEFLKCQKAMTSLASMGYRLIPFVDGEWKKGDITEWRIVPCNQLLDEYQKQNKSLVEEKRRRRSRSFENLLLAASSIKKDESEF